MTDDMTVDPDFGSEEWKERLMQEHKEQQFKEIMALVGDALLLAAERGVFSINAILSVAIQKLKVLGITCNINGQNRLEMRNEQRKA